MQRPPHVYIIAAYRAAIYTARRAWQEWRGPPGTVSAATMAAARAAAYAGRELAP